MVCRQGAAKRTLYNKRDPYGIMDKTAAIKPARYVRNKGGRPG
ncbi:hypothetical protein [Xylanivirga thermophila]|nr:hypothetical protein [Xylanivirga thermophila]